MIAITVEYENFDGENVEETNHFHLTKSDLMDLARDLKVDVDAESSVEALQEKLIDAKDNWAIFDFLKMFVIRAYGKRVGPKSFVKTQEVTDEFVYSPALGETLFWLIDDDGTRASEFLSGVLPKDLREKANAKLKEEGYTDLPA